MSNGIRQCILSLAIICTLLSFSQYEATFEPIMYGLWGLYALVELVPKHAIRFNRTIQYIVFIYGVWWLVRFCMVISGKYPPASSMGILGNVLICGIFYIIGNDDEVANNNVLWVMRAYLIGAMLLAIDLYRQVSMFQSSEERFGGKNAASQMLGLAALFGIALLQEFENKKQLRLLELLAGMTCLFVVFSLRSRTPLIAFFILFPTSIISGSAPVSSKVLKLVGTLLAVSIVVRYLGGFAYLEDLFSSYSSDKGKMIDFSDFAKDYNSANTLLSGRLGIYQVAIQDFLEHPLFGVGPFAYIDNFVLNILRTGGLALAVLLLPLTYGKMIRLYFSGRRYIGQSDHAKMIVQISQVIISFYFIISLMEGHPPLGPSTSVFIFWIVIGMRESIEQRSEQT